MFAPPKLPIVVAKAASLARRLHFQLGAFSCDTSHLIARLFVLLALFVATIRCSTSVAQEQTNDIAAKLAEICRKHDVPAMTAAVVNANALVTSDCFGIRKKGTSDKVELSDRFPIGSNTKSMTATLAAVMVDSGKIDWDNEHR